MSQSELADQSSQGPQIKFDEGPMKQAVDSAIVNIFNENSLTRGLPRVSHTQTNS
jgi:hypothetical protein